MPWVLRLCTWRPLWPLWLCVALWGSAHAQVGETELKAAFVFNFLQFVEWPRQETHVDDVVVVCISSFSPMKRALLSLEGKALSAGRTVQVRLLNLPELKTCHVLMVDATEADAALKALRALPESHGVLSIATESFPVAQDMVITLYRQDGRVAFFINADVATKAGLVISSKLMRLSKGMR